MYINTTQFCVSRQSKRYRDKEVFCYVASLATVQRFFNMCSSDEVLQRVVTVLTGHYEVEGDVQHQTS